MIRWMVFLVSLATAAEASAADAGDAPVAQPENAGATGSPSNATATVSPVSVAEAASRVDEAAAAGADRSSFGVSLGTSIAGGNFGSGQGSRIVSSALGARAAFGALRLTASIPYLNIRSRGVIFSGVDSTPVIVAGSQGGPRRTADGLGDLTVGAAYTFTANAGGPELELSGRVKFPTAARSDDLSTGKTDYSAGIQVTQTFGRVAPFASATYRVFGDPAAIDLRNGIALSVGSAISVGRRSTVLLSYHYARAASRLVEDSHELFAGASTRLAGSKLRLTGFATVGASKGAAAGSGGLSLSLDF